jgi:hypothetical protein
MEGHKTPRKDYQSLQQHRHSLTYATPDKLADLAEMADLGSPERNLLQIFLGTDRAMKVLGLPKNFWKRRRRLSRWNQ